jgi:hypothetical protein
MDVVDRIVLAQGSVLAAVLEEELQLLEGRIFGCAQQARHGKGPARIGPGRGRRQAFAAQPAAQET